MVRVYLPWGLFLKFEYLEPTFVRILEQACLPWNHFTHMASDLYVCVGYFWYPFKLISFQRSLLCLIDIGFKATGA